MNKAELVASVAEKSGLTKKDSAKAVDAIFSVDGALGAIPEALARGEKTQLVGFGTFEPKFKAAKKGRNPQTGKEIIISAHTTPVFKAGKPLKDAVN